MAQLHPTHKLGQTAAPPKSNIARTSPGAIVRTGEVMGAMMDEGTGGVKVVRMLRRLGAPPMRTSGATTEVESLPRKALLKALGKTIATNRQDVAIPGRTIAPLRVRRPMAPNHSVPSMGARLTLTLMQTAARPMRRLTWAQTIVACWSPNLTDRVFA